MADTDTRRMSFDDFIATYGRQRDQGVERTRYTGPTANAPHVIEERLPEGFEDREVCSRHPDRVVWSSDAELAIVVWEALRAGGYMVGGRLTMELWDSSETYHARLDDLAGVPA